MAEMNLRLEIRMSQPVCRAALAAVMLLAAAGDLASESVQLTTYYPAPSGVYTQLVGTSSSWLSRDAGVTTVGNGTSLAQNKLAVLGQAGVGTGSPDTQLTVLSNNNNPSPIFDVYPANQTQGVGIGYNSISEIGSNGNNPMYISAQGAGAVYMENNGSSGVNIGPTPVSGGWGGFTTEVNSNNSSNWAARFDSGQAYAYFADGAGYGAYIDAGPNASNGTYSLYVNHGGTPNLTVTGTGNVGIGTWPPVGSLDVGPDGTTTGMVVLRQEGCLNVPYTAGRTDCPGGTYATMAWGVYTSYWYMGTGSYDGILSCCAFGQGGAAGFNW